MWAEGIRAITFGKMQSSLSRGFLKTLEQHVNFHTSVPLRLGTEHVQAISKFKASRWQRMVLRNSYRSVDSGDMIAVSFDCPKSSLPRHVYDGENFLCVGECYVCG